MYHYSTRYFIMFSLWYRKVPNSSTSTPEHVYHLDNSVYHLDNSIYPLKQNNPSSPHFIQNPSSVEHLFDDCIYGIGYVPPPSTSSQATSTCSQVPPTSPPPPELLSKRSSVKKSGSIGRRKSSLKNKSESMSDLLTDDSGDYEEVDATPRSHVHTGPSHDEVAPPIHLKQMNGGNRWIPSPKSIK